MKKIMLMSRLNRRLRELNLSSFNDYYDYVTSPEGEANELVFLINEVSTNKTDFFREPDHFSYLTSRVLPEFSQKAGLGPRLFRVWSAGCSSGEEPYTLAMVLCEYQQNNPRFDFSIIATDISTKVLTIGEKGIFSNDRIEKVSAGFRAKYMMRGKGPQSGSHRIVPELRKKISFQRFNFMESNFSISKMPFNLIFCRNVIIYFDRSTQINLFRKFYKQLHPSGYIFIGHSETLPCMQGELERVASSVYRNMSGH